MHDWLTWVGVTDQKAQFIALMILIKWLKVCHYLPFATSTAVATHSDAYISRSGDFFVDNDDDNDNNRRTDQLSLYPLRMHVG